MLDAIGWALGMFLFCSFLASSNYYLDSELLMIGISAERASPTHSHSAPLLSLTRVVRLFVLGTRQEGLKKWKRVVGRPMEGR